MEENILQTQIISAPSKVKELLNRGEWEKNLEEISKKYSLAENQLEILRNETLFVLLRMEPLEEFPENLRFNLDVEEDKAYQIADDVYEMVLKEVGDFLAIEEEGGSERGSEVINSVALPETRLKNLPMLEEGEVAHEVPHVESTPSTPIETQAPKPAPAPAPAPAKKPEVSSLGSSYPDGKDPYREPLD